jgi:hypothetical protein
MDRYVHYRNESYRRRAEGLRAWADGLYTTTAAVELLIRFGPKLTCGAWVEHEPGRGWFWFNTDTIADSARYLSGGEFRILTLAASLADDGHRIGLAAVLPGLSRVHLDLVLAAVAHAAGSHEQSQLVYHPEDPWQLLGIQQLPSLYPWPVNTDPFPPGVEGGDL